MSEPLEPEILTAGSEGRRSMLHRFRRWYAARIRPRLRHHLGTHWQAGIALAVAIALGAAGGGWAVDAHADAAARRRDTHAVRLTAFAGVAGVPGEVASVEVASVEVALVNVGTAPVTITEVTSSLGAPVSFSDLDGSTGVLVPGASGTVEVGLSELDCAGPLPDRLSLHVGARGADSQPQLLEIPVVGADDALTVSAFQYCQDLASRLTARLAGDWHLVTSAGGPALRGMLEVVAQPPIGVQLLEVSGWAPFALSSPAISSSTPSAPAQVRGFAVSARVTSCSPAQPPDQGLLGLRARVRASDNREVETQVGLSTEAAAALVGLYDLVCGDATRPGGLRVDSVPVSAWRAERTGPDPVVVLHGTVTVTTTTDQVTLTGVSGSIESVDLRPGWTTPVRLSGRGRAHAIEVVATVYDCTLQEFDATPSKTFQLHGQAGGLPQTWRIPMARSLRQAAENACANAGLAGRAGALTAGADGTDPTQHACALA